MSGLGNLIGRTMRAKQAGGQGAVYTGVRHRNNPATGDRGPDAPGGRGAGGENDDMGRRRRFPRGRRLGGDVRTPLSP